MQNFTLKFQKKFPRVSRSSLKARRSTISHTDL